MILRALRKVFSSPFYIGLAILISFALLFLVVWLPHLTLIGIYMQADVSLLAKLSFLGSFLGSLGTSFTLFSAIYTVIIVILFGLNSAMIVYYLSRAAGTKTEGSKMFGVKLGGLVASLLGVGCASCGALLLTPLLGTAAAGFMVTYLPFDGAEFGILGVLILLWSMYSLAKKIDNPYK